MGRGMLADKQSQLTLDRQAAWRRGSGREDTQGSVCRDPARAQPRLQGDRAERTDKHTVTADVKKSL